VGNFVRIPFSYLALVSFGWLNDQYATYQLKKDKDRFIDLEQELPDLALK